ncbi:MAG: AAA family ATPase [Methanomicrobiales archaeon]|nr:AAA family ATPase [Methanomicrobiales archaeon]
MKVLGIVGLPASGKGVFSATAESMGIAVVVMGDVIRKEAARQGLPMNDKGLGEVAKKFRFEGGMDAIARLCIPEIERHTPGPVVIDGIRGDAEVLAFRRHFPSFFLVAIVADFAIRLSRLSERCRADDPLSAGDLIARDDRERSFGLDNALSDADVIIINDGSHEDFVTDVRAILQDILDGSL